MEKQNNLKKKKEQACLVGIFTNWAFSVRLSLLFTRKSIFRSPKTGSGKLNFTVSVCTGNWGLSACPFCLTSSFACEVCYFILSSTVDKTEDTTQVVPVFTFLAGFFFYRYPDKCRSTFPPHWGREVVFSCLLFTLYSGGIFRSNSTLLPFRAYDSPFALHHFWSSATALYFLFLCFLIKNIPGLMNLHVVFWKRLKGTAGQRK